MNYNHLTIEERCCIRKYYNEGKSFREIADLVGRNVSTISREIWRNKTYIYEPQTCILSAYGTTEIFAQA